MKSIGKYQIKDGSQELTGYIQFISKGGAFLFTLIFKKTFTFTPLI